MKLWQIHAYKHKTKIEDKSPWEFVITDYVEVAVEAETEKEALKKAKTMIKRKGYRVVKVWNKPEDMHYEIHLAQLEMQAKLLKKLG